MRRTLTIVRGRPRLFASAAIGIVAALLVSSQINPITHGLLAWDIACLALLVLSAQFSTPRNAGACRSAGRLLYDRAQRVRS